MLNQQDIAHAKQIDVYYKLYKADFRNAGLRYLHGEDAVDSDVIEVVENLPQKISRLFASMMFLEPYTLIIEEGNKGDDTRDMLYRNQFHKKLLQSAHSQSYAGYTAFEVSQVDNKAVISLIKPDYLFIEANPLGSDMPPLSIKVGWYFEYEKKKYLFMRKHTTELITSGVFECDALGMPTEKRYSPEVFGYTIPDEEPQFEHGIPVFVIHNDIHHIGNVYGSSDYEGNESLFQELARNMSQISNELHHFGNAILAVGSGVLDKSGRPKVAGAKMMQIDTDESSFVPQYITNNNPQIDKAQTNTEHILRAICRSTDIAELLVGLNSQGGAEKVGALRLRLLLTLARVKAKLNSYHAVLPSLVAFAALVEGRQVDAKNIYFEFKDGLPEDTVEMVDLEVKRYNAGLQSLSDSIRNLDNLDDKELEEKVAQIRDEEKTLNPFQA